MKRKIIISNDYFEYLLLFDSFDKNTEIAIFRTHCAVTLTYFHLLNHYNLRNKRRRIILNAANKIIRNIQRINTQVVRNRNNSLSNNNIPSFNILISPIKYYKLILI